MGPTRKFALSVVLIAGCMLGGFVFFILAVANVLPHIFLPSDPLEWAVWVAIILSEEVIMTVLPPQIRALNYGAPAFGGFVLMMACLTLFRMQKVGLRKSVYDSLTLIAPLILIVYELGTLLYYSTWTNAEVTIFVGDLGLGNIVTNLFVLEVSLVLIVLRGVLSARARMKK